MATVPGTPGRPIDDGGIPKELQPRQADLLIAASMLAQQEQVPATNIRLEKLKPKAK